MRCFKIGNINFTVASEEEARRVSEAIGDNTGRKLIIDYGDSVMVVDFKDQPCVIFTQSGDRVSRVGSISGGFAQQIILAAIGTIERSDKEAAKFRSREKKNRHIAKIQSLENHIKDFERSVPDQCRAIFLDVVNQICDGNAVYRSNLYQEIQAVTTVIPENWFHILQWYRGNVLNDSKNSKHALRKAFVTTVSRMGESDMRTSSALEKVVENDGNYWSKYVSEERRRDEGGS